MQLTHPACSTMIRKCLGCTCNSPIYSLAKSSVSCNIRKCITIVADYAENNGTLVQEMSRTYPYNYVSLDLNDHGILFSEHRSYTQGAKTISILHTTEQFSTVGSTAYCCTYAELSQLKHSRLNFLKAHFNVKLLAIRLYPSEFPTKNFVQICHTPPKHVLFEER